MNNSSASKHGRFFASLGRIFSGFHRPSKVGLGFVFFVAIIGYSEPLIERYVTHFSYDEQHTEYRLQPPGTRDVSLEYPTYDGDSSHFHRLDLNGDGVIGGDSEWRSLYWIDRFFGFVFDDYDGGAIGAQDSVNEVPDGRLSHAEYPATFDQLNADFSTEYFDDSIAFVEQANSLGTQEVESAVGQRFVQLNVLHGAAFGQMDTDGDGALSRNEVTEYRRAFRPFEDRKKALLDMDTNGNGAIERAEYLGAPTLHTFWLGTDHLGRDVLTRLIYGARISITIALIVTLISLVIGMLWGATAGYLGGPIDNVMMRFVDVLYGLPFLFIVILLIVIFGRSTMNLFIALGAIQWLTMARIVRGQVVSLKEREHVQAAAAMGASHPRILFRHVLPNVMGPVIVYATLMVPAVILEEAFLSFLGLGVQPPEASWGLMITSGLEYMETSYWLIVAPALMLALTLFSMNFVGDGLRDALDPKLNPKAGG